MNAEYIIFILCKVLFVSSSATRLHVCNEYDGTIGSNGTTFGHIIDALPAIGVRMWSPVFKDWVEISVRGNVYLPREDTKNGLGEIASHRTNEIVNGSIIDVGGSFLLFQGASQVRRQIVQDTPKNILLDINKMRPHCPVMFSKIEVRYMSDREKLLNSFKSKFVNKNFGTGISLEWMESAIANSFDDSEATHPFVFTSCGHVHAFSRELIGRYDKLSR